MAFFQPTNIEIYYSIDNHILDEYLQVVSEEVLSEPTYPKVYLNNGILTVDKGTAGEVLDKNSLSQKLDKNLKDANF